MKNHRTEEAAGGAGVEEYGRIPFEIVAAYEDSAARERTLALYRKLERALGADWDLKCVWWDLENLSDAKLRQQAASDAAEAKMIILSLSDREELPEVLKTWCDLWATRRGRHKAALVALLAGKGNSSPTEESLQHGLEIVARRKRLDFFLHRFDTNSDTATVTATSHAASVSQPIDPFQSKASIRQPTPRWGINE